MRLTPALKHGSLSGFYTALALSSFQSLWRILPVPVLAWILIPGLLVGVLVWGFGHLRGQRVPEALTGLEGILLVNALCLWLVLWLELPNPGGHE